MDASTELAVISVNGERRSFPAGITVMALVADLELDVRKVAVELNREIVPRSAYSAISLRSGDVLEIVHFIGGG